MRIKEYSYNKIVLIIFMLITFAIFGVSLRFFIRFTKEIIKLPIHIYLFPFLIRVVLLLIIGLLMALIFIIDFYIIKSLKRSIETKIILNDDHIDVYKKNKLISSTKINETFISQVLSDYFDIILFLKKLEIYDKENKTIFFLHLKNKDYKSVLNGFETYTINSKMFINFLKKYNLLINK